MPVVVASPSAYPQTERRSFQARPATNHDVLGDELGRLAQHATDTRLQAALTVLASDARNGTVISYYLTCLAGQAADEVCVQSLQSLARDAELLERRA